MDKLNEKIQTYLNKQVNEKIDKKVELSELEKYFHVNFKKKKDDWIALIKPKNSYDFFYIAGMMKDILKKLGYSDIELGRTENTFTFKKGPFILLVVNITKKNEFELVYTQTE